MTLIMGIVGIGLLMITYRMGEANGWYQGYNAASRDFDKQVDQIIEAYKLKDPL